MATYIWVDDALKALQAQGIRLPKPQRHQKATLTELLTIALFLTFIGLDLSKGYLLSQALLAHGHRIRGYALPGSGVGVGPLGGFAGYALVGVINDRGLFHRWALLSGNARETWARELLEGLEHVLGDRGGKLGPAGLTRWVEGVLTPPYRLRGGQVVETGWRGWVSRRLGFGAGEELDRDPFQRDGAVFWASPEGGPVLLGAGGEGEPHPLWGPTPQMNPLAHNLVRSHVLLKMAGVEL